MGELMLLLCKQICVLLQLQALAVRCATELERAASNTP